MDPESIINKDEIDSARNDNTETTTIGFSGASNDLESEISKCDNNKLETKDSVKDLLDTAIENKMEDQDGYESSDLELSSDDDSLTNAENDKSNYNVAEDDDDGFASTPAKTKHEMLDIPRIDIPEYIITPDISIEYIGDVLNIIDKAIIIQSYIDPKNVLNMESLLCFEDRSMLGEIFETFGPIARPFYSVRFNSKAEMPNAPIGTKVFWVPSYAKSQTVQVEVLKLIKGSDASNEYDEEIDENEMEFSDDEKELEYRQMRKRVKRSTNKKTHPAPNISPDINQGRQLQSYADITETNNHSDHSVSTLLTTEPSTSSQQQSTYTKSIKSIFDQPPPPTN
ncbi:Gar1/Naf1 RNA binding region-domain-containing protein [Cunninghamella echinulata]|nr:Gar1/Naf1 RNA binding region-domain-containing protein [Cunninghamella echinulata]